MGIYSKPVLAIATTVPDFPPKRAEMGYKFSGKTPYLSVLRRTYNDIAKGRRGGAYVALTRFMRNKMAGRHAALSLRRNGLGRSLKNSRM
jgi:hypothetical protein